LNLEGQAGWRCYNAGDAPEGGFFGQLPAGSTTFEVKAEDDAGNESPVVARPIVIVSGSPR